jgi:hypothetical protein
MKISAGEMASAGEESGESRQSKRKRSRAQAASKNSISIENGEKKRRHGENIRIMAWHDEMAAIIK